MNSVKTLILFLMGLILFVSCDARVKGFQILPNKHNFGRVPLGDSETVNFRIKNISSIVFTINDFRIVGNAAQDYLILPGINLPRNINPNSSITVSIDFTPTQAGDRSVYFEIIHSGPNSKDRIKITATAYAVPKIEINRTSYDYGLVLVNQNASADFDITSIGTADLNISSLVIVGVNANEFSITAGGNLPVIIQPGNTHTITVQIEPISDGMKSASLQIIHDGINENSPIICDLTGDAITHAAEISLNQTSPWDFGLVTTNRLSKQLLEITNTGLTDLGVTSIRFATGTVFRITEVTDSTGNPINEPYTLVPADMITAEIEFRPTSTANFNDTLTIIHDGINVASPLNISVTGSGRTPVTQNFSHTGSAQTFTVPAGVYEITVTANGAGGGGPTGGAGGKIVGVVSVTPGQVLQIIVGGKGENATYARSANGGGGFSGILLSGNHVISAGGAGGCAGTGGSPYGSGGNGGGSSGQNGGNGGCGQGGVGGTAGGSPSGGIGGVSGGEAGQPGTSTGGGRGGNGRSNQASGGGGGGYGTGKGIGGTQYSVNGKGGDGGFGGGGGGGGGGWGGTVSRLSAGGGGGGGYAGGAGGTAPTGCGTAGGGGGGGGAAYAASNVNVTTNSQGTGAARGQHGSLSINY